MKRLFLIVSLLMVMVVAALRSEEQKGPIAPPKREVPGKRFELSRGQLYVPDFFDPALSPTTEMVLFFHGAAWCSEQEFYDARKNAVLLSITVPNYGYPEVFAKPERLRGLLEETVEKLAQEEITQKPLGKLCLASFSGGYSAIREILKQKEFEPLITDVVLADSLYGPREEGTTDTMAAEAMAPFVEYARRAAAGEVGFWFSHLYPPEEEHRGNTTTLTATYLIEKVGAKKQQATGCNSRGERLLYRADAGNFHLLGYAGMTTQDHFEHFYALSDLLQQTSLTPAKSKPHLIGFTPYGPFNEQKKEFIFDPDARVHINAPNDERFDPAKLTRLVLFALPNGNSIEWTIGKKVQEGMDWHYGIQHIGAQTRRLRDVIKEENIVVVYLEAAGKSWPSWRKKHEHSGHLIKGLVESLADHVWTPTMKIHLSGHSGGGSFIFGYLNTVDCIPDSIERITFMDSNYGYSDEEGHGDKFIEWLKRSPEHHLCVLCYDDRNVQFRGKLIVGPTGGTYRKTYKMLERLHKDIELTRREDKELIRYRGMDGQIDIIIHKNPENKILHTMLVGDMNGLIHTETSGTGYEDKAGLFNGPLAYEKWIEGGRNH